MKKLVALLAFLFICIAGTMTIQGIQMVQKQEQIKAVLPNQETASFSALSSQRMVYPISAEYLLNTTRIAAQKGPVYYVKIGDTISLLKDPQGYIIAAKRLGMTTIKVVPDKSGKFYRTVSLDLNQSDEDLKKAIEVETENIIIK